MNQNLKKYAQLAKMKLQDFYPDEHKEHGWTNVTCTDKELNRFLELIINDIIHETQQGKVLTTYKNFIGDK
jgi:hypothetical protein